MEVSKTLEDIIAIGLTEDQRKRLQLDLVKPTQEQIEESWVQADWLAERGFREAADALRNDFGKGWPKKYTTTHT